MLDASTLTVFFASAAVLLLIPGPAVLYIAARSIDQGRIAGLVSVAGIAFGTLFHIFAAAFGLSALLMQSAMAFNLIKFAGAAYLIYLGIQRFRTAGASTGATTIERESLGRIFRNGIVVNLLNPKTSLFFFAFLPQFVRPERGAVTMQILILGLLFLALAIVSDAMYALAADRAATWLRGRASFGRSRDYVTGTVYIGLGVAAALTGSRPRG